MRYESTFSIGERTIALDEPTYFIADLASNHDGDLQRAKELIWLCKEAGADAAKFQHFLAKDIVSDYGFRALGSQLSHQASWQRSVYETYEHYELKREWTAELAQTAAEAGITFLTAPYDEDAIQSVAGLVPAFKVGSGDITWIESIESIAMQGKPVLLATGAATLEDVERAVDAVLKHNRQLCLMQCNTNYTGVRENFGFVNLRVLESFAICYPGLPLGLSDHTSGHAAVLGAIALGARVVEKHFTDDTSREGPDHTFALDPESWREMVERARELEDALGDGIKRIEGNERDTVVAQRRCLRVTRDVAAHEVLSADDLECLRPAPDGAIPPYEIDLVRGRALARAKVRGDALYHEDLG